jgi:lysophospholipase L1-like esterase
MPIPHSAGPFHGSRDIAVQHNALGLRDIEYKSGQHPTILFVGDSFVWGYDVQADARFTDRLRTRFRDANIVNVGVPGYGTAQEYLLLKPISDAIKPDVVILIFCTANDREDNTTNVNSASYYRPYLEEGNDGRWRFAGQPVPWS